MALEVPSPDYILTATGTGEVSDDLNSSAPVETPTDEGDISKIAAALRKKGINVLRETAVVDEEGVRSIEIIVWASGPTVVQTRQLVKQLGLTIVKESCDFRIAV